MASRTYLEFLLADLFYSGYSPSIDVLNNLYTYKQETYDIYLSSQEFIDDCKPLVYNPLKRNIKKKTSYLLSRPYTVSGSEEVKKYFSSVKVNKLLKNTVVELLNKGEVWWEFEPDNTSPIKFGLVLRKAQSIVPHYTDEECTEYDSVGYLWNNIDDEQKVHRYADFVDSSGRHRFALSKEGDIQAEELGHAKKEGKDVLFKSLPFVRLTYDGLYQQIFRMVKMYSNRYVQADSLVEDNADPVAVVKNASGTDDQILMDDIRENKLVKVEGDGDFSYASKSADYSSIQNFMSALKSDISDVCGVVSREQELQYVTSSRALDRLYIDMDNDAADMGDVLRDALTTFLGFIAGETSKDFVSNFGIIFNTDKPTDEQAIIQNINSSRELLSKRTLLEQHPWVEDVDEELERIESEQGESEKQNPPPDNDESDEEGKDNDI